MKHTINIELNLNDIDSIKRVVNIYNSLMSSKYRLQSREVLYFCHVLYLYYRGLDLFDTEFYKILNKKLFDNKGKGVYLYKGRLIKKSWVIEDNKGYQLPIFFKQLNNNLTLEIKLNEKL